jgi:hypothetical protein
MALLKEMEVNVVRMGDRRGVCRYLVEKSEGKRLLGRSRRRLVFNIKIDLQEVGCHGYGLDSSGSG